MRDLPFQGFEVDAKVDLGLARRLLGERIALKGNLDTTFLLRRSAEEVRGESLRILRQAPPGGVVFSPGCGVPRMTPLANLRAMVQASEEHAGSSR
jgi:uroporphyrinogen-III decarboxylase